MISNGMSFLSADFVFPPHEQEIHPPPHHTLPQDFPGFSPPQMRRSMSFSGVGEETMQAVVDDDVSDDGSEQLIGSERKKIRLSMEQVKALEKSFEVGNKLEPERKMQLARALGLQPRQVAIWFQNRRARWKTKQLERDYDVLKRKFEALKADNDVLLAHNKNLHAELLALKGTESTGINIGPIINLNKETEGSWSNGSDNHHHHHHHQTSCDKQIFHSSIIGSHLLQNSSSRSAISDIQFQKIDQTVPEESFCNMFMGGVADQSGFWSWPEQQHLH